MKWQSKIYYKYRLDEPVTKIIIDYTGILLHNQFTNYLCQEGKRFFVACSVPEILDKLSGKDSIIIADKLDIPSFISSKFEVHSYQFKDLPVSGDSMVFTRLKTEEIVSLINFIEFETPHISVTEKNLKELLTQAKLYETKKSLSELSSSIQEELESELSGEKVQSIGEKWSKIQYQSFLLDDTQYLSLADRIDKYCNSYFETGKWEEVYHSSTSNPKIAFKIIHKLKQDKAERKALLCFDCMGLPEWLLLKEFLSELNLSFEESTVFSLLPSITSIARSAIYAGTYSVYDKSNPGQPEEEKDFTTFFGKDSTVYLREKDFQSKDVLLGYNTVSILFNFFDELSHSAVIQSSSLNKFGYYKAVRDYLEKSNVKAIFKELIDQKFTIYICSDHGSTIAKGNGKKIEKFLHDKFAKRGTVIDVDAAPLIEHKKIPIPFIENKMVVLPENREMFSTRDHIEINHGGISIDEMLVPFVIVKP